MNTHSKLLEIRKNAFTEARERFGFSAKDLGGMACLSTRQIEQIENGETSSFYGAQNKFTAAKKVAKLLKLTDEEAFEVINQEQAPLSDARSDIPASQAEQERSLQSNVEEKKSAVKGVQTDTTSFSGAATQSGSNLQKKMVLWFVVLAAGAFAVMNLHPIFFADKPEELVLVKEEFIEPVPSAAPAEPVTVAPTSSAITDVPPATTPAVSVDVSTACPGEEGIISYKPDTPRKAADMVFVQVKVKQVICVSDASGKMQNKTLEPGAGASFFGKPPFKILTTGLNQVDVFFQGAKVRLLNPNSKTLILEAAELIAAPSDRADSQLR